IVPTAFALNKVESEYGDHALSFKSKQGDYSLRIENRIQLRYSNPFDTDPRTPQDVQDKESSFMIRRARLKLNGHAGESWLKYGLQYDWAQPVLRDAYLEIAKYPWARLRVGRGKVIWNDERVSSSGRQQFVNRSILNDVFTVDRQQGLQLLGRLGEDS